MQGLLLSLLVFSLGLLSISCLNLQQFYASIVIFVVFNVLNLFFLPDKADLNAFDNVR